MLQVRLLGGILFIGQICWAVSLDSTLGYTYSEEAGGWLRLARLPATVADARLRCQIEGGALAVPTSNLTSSMIRMMKSEDPAVNAIVIGETSSNLHLPWAEGQPDNDNQNNAEDCLAMTDDGEMADVDCKSKHRYFCYKHGDTVADISCGTWDDGYKLDTRTGSCYKFYTTPRSWYGAESVCREAGAHLAVINSKTESKLLKDLYDNYSGDIDGASYDGFVYIGYRDWEGNDEWHTIFGHTFQEAGFGTWGGGEPNHAYGREHCGTLRHDGLLNDYFCDSRLAFICEISTK